MRFLPVLALSTALAAAPALAADTVDQTAQALKGQGRYGLAGCGLGSMAFGTQPGGVQVFAATTNNLFGTQTFGITSGTSNCGPGLLAQGTKNLVESNRVALAKDVARGEGDLIGALTVINGCADFRAVGSALQRDFRAIFPSDDASDQQVTDAILRTLQSDPALGCARG